MSSVNKYTPTNQLNQAIFSACHKKQDYQSLLTQLTRSQKVILNHVIKQYLFFDFDMRESQDLIGNSTGYTRQTVNHSLSVLSKLGLISIEDQHQGAFSFDTLRYIPNINLFRFKFYLYDQLKALRRVTFGHLQKLNLMGNLTPYKKIFISKPCKYMYQLLEKGASAVSRGMSYLKNHKRTMESIMNEVGALTISPTLRDITEKLRLTKLGQVKLLAFNDDVLRIVWSSLKSSKNVKSPFDWLIVACEQYCVANKIKIDWDIFYSLLKRYNLVDTKKYIQSATQSVIPSVSSSAKIPRWKMFPSDKVAPGFEKFDQQRTLNLNEQSIA